MNSTSNAATGNGPTDNSSTSVGVTGTTRQDKWLLRIMNDPRTRRAHATGSRRRAFVAAHVVLTGVIAAGMALIFLTESVLWSLAALVPLLLWIPVTGVLNASTRGLLELRAHVLDERQLAERGAVHTLAHAITLKLMATALLAFAVLHLSGTTLDALAVPLAVTGFAAVVLCWLMPLWVAALRAEDEPEDEGDVVDEGVAEAGGTAV